MSEDEDRESHEARRDRKKRRRRESRSLNASLDAISYAAAGRTRKLRKLLSKRGELDINFYNAEGATALHQAAKFGHTDTVAYLLRHGADSRAEDFGGNTPAHLAASRQHLTTLAELLQGDGPDLDAANGNGLSIRRLMQIAIEARVGEAASKPHASPRTDEESPAESAESEDAWQQKLRENAGFDDFQSGTADWDGFEYSSIGSAGARPESEETYARRMWEAMNAKLRGAHGPSAATASTWAAADDAQAKRRRAAADAAEASRRILEEEQAKDQAWRQAVLQGDLGARRATYEAKWHVFANSGGPVSLSSVPWLVEDRDDARAVILYGTGSGTERRKRIRLELMRWHPDKFFAKFGGRMSGGDMESILERVKHISQMLNSLSAADAS